MADHITFKITKNNILIKELKQLVQFNDNKLENFVFALKQIENDSNTALTDLVNSEHSGETNIEESEGEDDDEEADVCASPKRKSNCDLKKCKKIKT